MPVAASRQRTSRRSLIPAITVAVVLVLVVVIQAAVTSNAKPGPATPVFPREVAAYSWWTGMLSLSSVDVATMVYQNGAGVEFLDSPQAVLLGADGGVYRRLDAAESLGISADQGDPAARVLSADGRFVVVGKADGGGGVEVTRLRDNDQRSVVVGDGLSTIPVSIAADGRSVLILTSETSLSRVFDLHSKLHGALSLLDLETGTVRKYTDLTDVSAAALSPNGTSIAAETGAGLVVVHAVTGKVADIRLSTDAGQLDGDAWSPDGRRFALLGGNILRIVDVTVAEPVEEAVTLQGVASGSAIGWRDTSTVLVHTRAEDDANESEFSWVDVESGAREQFASYAPDFTGASLIAPDVARGLVPLWRVDDREVDRGPPLLLTIPLAVLLGLVAWIVTPRRRRPRSV